MDNDEEIVRCKRCNRKLKNPASKQLGLGKKCAEKELTEFYEKNQTRIV